MIIEGKITKKEKKGDGKGKKGYWERWVYTIEDKNYSTFDMNIVKQFNQGDMVRMETKTDGKYENMVSMTKIEDKDKVEVVKMNVKAQEFHLTEEACRSNALNAAISYAYYSHLEVSSEQILALAEQFCSYIKNGRQK